jgi:hypothetical protein
MTGQKTESFSPWKGIEGCSVKAHVLRVHRKSATIETLLLPATVVESEPAEINKQSEAVLKI